MRGSREVGGLHTLYQAMNLAFADRDFYYGDPYFPPAEPTKGLLSKTAPARREAAPEPAVHLSRRDAASSTFEESPFSGSFFSGTTSVEAADAEGWVVSVTPSGGWLPGVIAGKTGIGMSQRMQSFVLDRAENPFNVLEPGKRPRVTLTPTLAQSRPGAMMIHVSLPAWVRGELTKMGYKLEPHAKTSGPINAIYLDREHGTMWGGSSDHGENYGIGW